LKIVGPSYLPGLFLVAMAFVKVGQSSIRTALVHGKSGYNVIKQRSLGLLRVRAIPLAKVYPVHSLAKQFLRIAIGNSTLPTLHTVIMVQAITKAKAKYKADMAKLGINVDPGE
jgi:hypothetical protein